MSTPLKFTLSGLLVALGITGFVLGTASMRADLVRPWDAGFAAHERYLRMPMLELGIWLVLVLVCAVLPHVRRPSIDPIMGPGLGALLVIVGVTMFPSLASNVPHGPLRDADRVTNSVAEAIKVSAKQSGHWPTVREVEVSAGVGRMPTPWLFHGIPLLYEVTIDKRDAASFAVPPRPGIIACVTDDAAAEIECRFTPPERSDLGPDEWKSGVLVARRYIKDRS